LMNEFNIIPFWFNIGKLWPLVFVAIGVSFIMKSKNKNAWEEWKRQTEEDAAKAEAKVNQEPVTPVTDMPVAETPPPTTAVDDTSHVDVSKVDDRFTKKDI